MNNAMATSRLPGPFGVDDPFLDNEDQNLIRGGLRHRQHMPGPAGFWTPTRTWRAGGFVALYGENVDDLVEDLTRWESMVLFMYLDTKGLVTVGIGNLLRTVDAALELAFVNTHSGASATEDEVRAAFEAVSNMEPGLLARRYKLDPSIEIPNDDARALARERLRNEFLPALRRAFPDFDDFPASARRFMVDMAYNGGVGFFKKRLMDGLIKERKWLESIACLPTQGNPRRRAWREGLLRAAAKGI